MVKSYHLAICEENPEESFKMEEIFGGERKNQSTEKLIFLIFGQTIKWMPYMLLCYQ